MDTETGRWLAPLASAATVGTLIIGMSQLSGGAAGGPGPGPVPDRQRPTPTAAVTRPLDFSGMSGLRQSSRRTAAAAPVRIDSRTGRGRVLTLNYTITVRDCSSRIARPAVVESAQGVTVTLHRLKPQPGQRQICPEILLANSVEVRLHAPLGHRPVRDGARSGASVPAARPNGATYPPR